MKLHRAAQAGHAKTVAQLLNAGADPNARDIDGRTPLMLASAHIKGSVVRLLLDAGADVNATLPVVSETDAEREQEEDVDDDDLEQELECEAGEPSTALAMALHADYDIDEERVVDVVEQLLNARANVNATDELGHTPLMFAVWRSSVPLVTRLLAASVQVNAASRYGVTALMCALMSDTHRDANATIFRELLNAGADIHQCSRARRTPLMYAAKLAYLDEIRILLKKGADPLATDRRGRNALTFAAKSLATLESNQGDRGYDLDEIQEALKQMGMDPDSEAGRTMTARMLGQSGPSDLDLMMSGIDSAEEFESTRTEGIRRLNKVIDLLADAECSLDAAGPYLATTGRIDLLKRIPAARWNETDDSGETALTHAVKERQVDRVRQLLEAGADPNALNYFDEPPLACVGDSRRGVECGRLLLAAGANVNQRARNDMTLLEIAISESALPKIRFLLEAGADAGLGAPLIWAVRRGELKLVRLLLEHGANPNAQLDVDGEFAFAGFLRDTTPLMRAAADQPIEMLQLLVEAGADPRAVDREGRTAVDVAMAHGRLKVAEWLRGVGAVAPNAAAFSKALLPAAEQGDVARVNECLTNGADPNVRGEHGVTPLILAAREGHANVVASLLEAGADVNARSDPGYGGDQTPLRCAIVRGHSGIARRLIQAGADVHPVYASNSIPAKQKGTVVISSGTALHDACRAGDEETVDALLAADADVDAVDEYDETPLVASVQTRRWSLAERLLSAGAVRRPQDADRLAPLEFAAATQHAFAESVTQMEKLCGSPGTPAKDIPGMVVFTVTPDGTSPPPGEDADSWKAVFEFEREFDAKKWRVLNAAYQDCLARGHLVIDSGMPWMGGTEKRFVYLLPTANKYAVMELLGVRGNDQELSTRDIVTWFREFEKEHPFHLRGCRFDIVVLELLSPPSDPSALAEQLVAFCHDYADNFDSRSTMVEHLSTNRRIHLWWD
jgi:ankyrin